MIVRLLPAILLALLAFTASAADDIVLKEQHPQRYVVKKGDTLWDIAARFLRDPWRWPDIWYVNPQIENPHLIYPGDQVELTYKDGKPQLTLRRGGGRRTVKLSPQVRREPLQRGIPTIPMDAIRQFLGRPGVVTDRQLEQSPYIVSSEDKHLVMGKGDHIYVSGIVPGGATRYRIIRPGETYADPDSGEVLGHESIYVGEAVVERFGDPAVLRLTHSDREALTADRLLPAESEPMLDNFVPHAPEGDLQGRIIDVVDGVSRIGQYQTVVLNKGERDGLEEGHVLGVYRAGDTIRDPVERDREVTLPDVEAGYVFVFRTFDRVSYALVMKAVRDMRIHDMVRNPT